MTSNTRYMQRASIGAINTMNLIDSTASLTPTSGDTPDEVFQLRLELNALRQRLKAIDEGGNKSKLLDLIEESKEEVAIKNKQIASLNDKFQQVTQVVTQMEADHDSNIKTIASLESENKRLTRHLSIREKEITTLVSRCATQEERLAAVKDARMLEKTMNQKVDELNKQLLEKDSKIAAIPSLEQTVVKKDQDIVALKSKIEELELKHTKDCAALLNRVSNLEKQLNDLTVEKGDLQKNIDFINQEKLRQENEYRAAREEINLELLKGREREESLRKTNEDNMKKSVITRTEMDEELRSKSKEIAQLKIQLSQLKDDSEQILRESISKLTREKENEVMKLEADISCKDELITSLNRHVNALKEASESLDRDYKSMSKQREDIVLQRRDDNQRFESERQVLTDRLTSKDEEIKVLQISLLQVKQDLLVRTTDIDRSKSKIVALEEELSQLRQDLQGKITETQVFSRDLQLKLAQEEETVRRLREQMTKDRDAHEQDKTSHSSAMKTLEESLQKMRDTNGNQEKELRQLSGQLSQSKDEVSALKKNIALLVVKVETTELQAAEVVDDLEKKICNQQMEAKATEEKLRSELKALESQVASLKTEINLINTTKGGLELSIKSRDVEIESYRSKFESMQKQILDQNAKITSLHLEMDNTLLAHDKLKTDYMFRISSIERELSDEKARSTREAAVFQEDYEKLQVVAAQTEEALDQKDSELRNTQIALAEKSNDLAATISQSNKLGNDLMEARKLITELQEESDNYIRQKEAAEAAIVKLKSDIDRMEDCHISAIQKERNHRMSVEEELAKAKVALDAARFNMKEFNDLEGYVEVLKDKVKRQEAYMKKKLHQEKLLKERMGVISISTPRSPDAQKKSSFGSSRRTSDDHSIASGMEDYDL